MEWKGGYWGPGGETNMRKCPCSVTGRKASVWWRAKGGWTGRRLSFGGFNSSCRVRIGVSIGESKDGERHWGQAERKGELLLGS